MRASGGGTGGGAITAPWQTHPASIVLPLPLGRAILEAARARHLRAGGCFSVHGATVVVWSERAGRVRPAGSFSVRWHAPRPDAALVDEIAWPPGWDGAEGAVRCALRLLIARASTR